MISQGGADTDYTSSLQELSQGDLTAKVTSNLVVRLTKIGELEALQVCENEGEGEGGMGGGFYVIHETNE